MIVRVHKNNNYSVVDNTCFNDPRLSLKAKGLAGYLFTKPDDWSINARNISYYSTDGLNSIWAGLRELEEFGYIVRRRVNDHQTGYLVWEYDLYETPRQAQHLIEMRIALERAKTGKPPIKHRSSPNSENPSTVYPCMDKPRVDKPCMDKPRVDKPCMDNRGVLNTDLPITEEPITDQINTEEPNTEGAPTQLDDDDAHPPITLLEIIPTRVHVTRARVRDAMRNGAGEVTYHHDYIYRLGLSSDALDIAILDAAHRATMQAVESGWDDRAQWLQSRTLRERQHIINWCYRILYQGSEEIRNPVGLIKKMYQTQPEIFAGRDRSQLAWFHEICITNHYIKYEDSLTQGGLFKEQQFPY